MYRIAQPGEFTFKRDSHGVETIETGGLVVGTTRRGLFGPVVTLHDFAKVDQDTAQSAARFADRKGFWNLNRPAPRANPVAVTVHVKESETI